MLILTGVAISISVNGGDLFGKATTARDSWNSAVAEENSTISSYLAYLDQYIDSSSKRAIEDVLLINKNGNTAAEKSPYVNYTDANGNTLLCRVLHSDARGIDIITDDVIKNGNEIVYITLGADDPNVSVSDFGDSSLSDDTRKAAASYNRALTTLNSFAEDLRNKTDGIATSARCVGSLKNTTVATADTSEINGSRI